MDRRYTNSTICSRPIFDYDALAPTLRKLLRQNAGDDVTGAAGLVGRHDRDSAGWEFVRVAFRLAVRARKPAIKRINIKSPFGQAISRVHSVGVTLVRVPGWLLRVVGTVVHLYNDRLFMRDSWAMHIALRIAVEATRRQYDPG